MLYIISILSVVVDIFALILAFPLIDVLFICLLKHSIADSQPWYLVNRYNCNVIYGSGAWFEIRLIDASF